MFSFFKKNKYQDQLISIREAVLSEDIEKAEKVYSEIYNNKNVHESEKFCWRIIISIIKNDIRTVKEVLPKYKTEVPLPDDFHLALSEILERRGFDVLALKWLIASDRKSIEHFEKIVRLIKDLDKKKKFIEKNYELLKNSLEIKTSYVASLYQTEEYQKAEEFLSSLENENSHTLDVWCARVKYSLSKEKEAFERYEKILKDYPYFFSGKDFSQEDLNNYEKLKSKFLK